MKRDARLKSMTSSEIRGSFLEFFRKNGHAVLPSSSLLPGNDATLLFTNAGMVQFKDVFLGKDVRDYSDLEFFRKNGHAVLPSSSLLPGNDATLLFTNAGMVQFKDVFLGKDVRDY